VLDRSLGGGWPAVVTSTVLIVIFGEVVPQSICVRFGLSIGAYMAPIVTGLMWIMGPVAWPTAKLLDYLLGEDHGTMYKKAGLKTLVTLHKTLGTGAGEQLMEDEVTIINSVLDLKEKPVGGIMTPMQDVFTMSADTVLDEKMMDTILSQGYSRIPIYSPTNGRDFIGMLLVKILITYDPEDCKRVRDFALATLPETAPHTSCLDIINFFQEGKSHMVLVSDFPGQDKGALGVVTLEDVIEELIGEEIIDESDVFVDVHKAIRRLAPAPKTRFGKTGGVAVDDDDEHDTADERTSLLPKPNKDATSKRPSLANGQQTTFLMRRKSSAASDATRGTFPHNVPEKVRSGATDMREHLKHLGPSNAASKPRATKYTSVKIKPGVGTIPENKPTTTGMGTANPPPSASPLAEEVVADKDHPAVEEAVEALRSDSRGASAGAAAVFGNLAASPALGPRRGSAGGMSAKEASLLAEQNAVAPPAETNGADDTGAEGDNEAESQQPKLPEKIVVGAGGNEIEENAIEESGDTVGELGDKAKQGKKKEKRGSSAVRSGSITETMVEGEGGIRKVVLETTSSSSEEGGVSSESKTSPKTEGPNDNDGKDGSAEQKKKNRKKRGGNGGGGNGETS
jgi:metal transporter CNNM